MTRAKGQGDLIGLVADRNMHAALSGILNRPASVRIREVAFAIRIHPQKDPGVLRQAHDFLRTFAGKYRHALVLFDREGCGQEGLSRERLEADIEARLAANGWPNNAAAIAIDPELESWVWSDSPEVEQTLGWAQATPTLREWLSTEGLLGSNQTKPPPPKEAMEAALRRVRLARSSALYQKLAARVSFQRCTDPAFEKLKRTLQTWFPAETQLQPNEEQPS